MPRCLNCNNLLPTQCFPEDEQVKKCLFCIRGQDEFEVGSIDDGFVKVSKKTMIEDYKLWLKELSMNKNIAEIIIKCEKEKNEL